METLTLDGTPPIEVNLRRTASARRLSLRVSRLDGRVSMSMPRWTARAEAISFLRAKEDWIRRNLDGSRPREVPAIGGSLPYLGVRLPIAAGTARGVRLTEAGFLVPADPARVPRLLQAFLRVAARDRLAEASDRHAATLGRAYSRLSLRDTRSRWGSCTPDGALMYSWRLVMAPHAVLDYVAAHEVAHLQEMNHGPQFWALVSRLCPDYRRHREWLRTIGRDLHMIRFAD